MSYIDVTGKTEEEAVRKGLEQLGMDRDDVSVEILERAKSGFLGIGSSCNRSCRRCSRMVYRDRVCCDRSILQLDCQCIYLQGSYLEGCLEEPGAVH